MSAVRMCDNCGDIFPEGEEGAAVVQGTRNVRNERTGRIEQHHVQEDRCRKCAGPTEIRPRLAVESGSGKSSSDRDTVVGEPE